jgi:hypothetical protein
LNVVEQYDDEEYEGSHTVIVFKKPRNYPDLSRLMMMMMMMMMMIECSCCCALGR